MTATAAVPPLDRDTAIRICPQGSSRDPRQAMVRRLVAVRGCRRFSHGDPEKMRVTAEPGYRGCELASRRQGTAPEQRPPA